MRTMMKQLTMTMGLALLLAAGSASVAGHGGSVAANATASIDVQADQHTTELGRRPTCPICDTHCCNTVGQ